MLRETSELWVQAYLRRCQGNGYDAVLARRGQRDAGAIWLRIAGSGTDDLYGPAMPDLDAPAAHRRWERYLTASPAEIDQRLAREASFDDDLWVIDVWGSGGRTGLTDDEIAPDRLD